MSQMLSRFCWVMLGANVEVSEGHLKAGPIGRMSWP